MFAERQQVTVTDACTQKRTGGILIAVAVPLHVEPTYVSMYAEEMPFAGTCQPIAAFRLDGKGLNGVFTADVPRAPEYGQFYREMFAHLHIGGKVHYRTRPCRKVGLDGHVAG